MTKKLPSVGLYNSLYVLLVITVLISSCGRKISVFNKNIDSSELNISDLEFDYLSIKSKIELKETHKTTNTTALIRIKKDSLIWFNLSGTLGVQGLRGLISKDSVVILNRIEKTYQTYSFKDISHEFDFPIDYNLIQAMIIGNMPKGEVEDQKIRKEGSQYVIRQNIANVFIKNHVSANNMKLVEVSVLEKSTDNSLKLLYKDFKDINGQALAFSSFVSLIHNNEFGELETQLTINHLRVEESDKSLKFPFSIPKKYENSQAL